MKLIIDNYEVEIKAKDLYGTMSKMNEEDTKSLLTRISLWAYDAGEWNKIQGYTATGENEIEAFHSIYEQTH